MGTRSEAINNLIGIDSNIIQNNDLQLGIQNIQRALAQCFYRRLQVRKSSLVYATSCGYM